MSVADSYNGYAARTLRNDGTSPTSPVLYDGADTYTPGLGEQASDGSAYSYEVGGALGTTDGMLTVSNGNTQNWGAEYDAFGNQLSVTLTPGFLPGPGLMEAFGGGQGYQTDSDTGLVRCGNRYYWPLFGRWLTQDPAGAGDNWYGYCGNEPTAATDRSGLQQQSATGGFTPLDSLLQSGGASSSGGPAQSLEQELSIAFGYSLWSAPPGETQSQVEQNGQYLGTFVNASANVVASSTTSLFSSVKSWVKKQNLILHAGTGVTVALGVFQFSLNGGGYASLSANGLDYGGSATLSYGWGVGLGASGNFDAGAGLGTLAAYNGWGNSFSAVAPILGGSWDWNNGYHGFTFSVAPIPMPILGFFPHNTTATGTISLGHS